ncbi:DNA-directed RNA polymerase subunit beta, putative, partial (apicoplast) [Plasmodium reichenowi]
MIYIINPILVKNNYIISNLYLLLIQEIIYNLRYYILFLNNNINIKFNFIYYKIIILLTNININSIDTIQNINNLLKIILTLKLNFININKIIKFNILIFILPFIYNNIIILNGLYKICIQLFKKNNKIFIIKFKNNNKNIIYVYIYISFGLRIIFKISKLNIYCYFNNFKFNFLILLLYLNNIYINKNISLFIYNNIINKKILIYNYIKFIYSKYNNINNIISLKLFIIKLNKFNNIYMNLLKILFSIKFNFSYYSDFYINNIYNKKFYSIIDNLLIKSKKYLKIFKYQLLNINKNIYNNIILLLNNKKYINIILENININPLVQYSDQINNLSEINQKFKINMITTGLNSKFILNNDLRELPRNILGYISLINTNEGLTCGLVNYLTTNIFLNLKYLFVIYYKYIFYNKYNFKLLLNIFNKNFYNISFNNIYLKKNINFNKTTILTINKNT